MPAEHPARDMQDTLYLASPVRSAAGSPATLLRTDTSGMQIRYMEKHAPPVRLIAPGRVYRRDNFDLTHTPMFTQVEGLVVGETVSLADLKGTLTAFAKELFGAERRVRFRPSFFPYTEPSAEVDISCGTCGGSGLVSPKLGPDGSSEGGLVPRSSRRIVRAKADAHVQGHRWAEILGSGMVHPAVFEAVGYDSERYTGFSFGMGIERAALLKWGVEDIRRSSTKTTFVSWSSSRCENRLSLALRFVARPVLPRRSPTQLASAASRWRLSSRSSPRSSTSRLRQTVPIA